MGTILQVIAGKCEFKLIKVLHPRWLYRQINICTIKSCNLSTEIAIEGIICQFYGLKFHFTALHLKTLNAIGDHKQMIYMYVPISNFNVIIPTEIILYILKCTVCIQNQ